MNFMGLAILAVSVQPAQEIEQRKARRIQLWT